ncbi:unnamed protein product (macronuclear) [Paramecium tetraurelia]|uniref:SAM domain-containing protein n=1 Tax=Paramecium tetraurelia TaxID=5888 RepID=A0DJ00_PARTE|nr:uncharacterized protein GSPATT00017374001 [Paramecium tetraurelia]CAK83017.1 unnamed protein product [Paramecium tetraurelia]|eukprot:XP_001450414.1 hypothetical protein (macronuclear) [Paramecium tetraurelia strain d4-2]
MIKNRGSSSNKTSNPYALQMQEEAKKMAEKLAKLKQNLNSQKMERSQISKQSGDMSESSRWQNNTTPNNRILKDRPPSNKSEPIESFLKSIKLDTYVQKFKENGFEELDILFDIQKEQLQQMEIPLGHQIRLMKKIRELKQSVEMNEVIIQNESKYDELEGILLNKIEPLIDLSFTNPKKRSSLQKERQKSLKKVTFKENDDQKGYLGVEQSFHQSFILNELEEISNYMQQNHIGEIQNIDIDIQTNSELEQIDNNFSSVSVSKQKPYDEQNVAKLRIKKAACWNCFKLLIKDYIVLESNEFCSYQCYQKYNHLYLVQCVSCSKQFDIRNGVLLNGCSFCDEQCAQKYDFQIMKDNNEEIEKQFLGSKCINIHDQSQSQQSEVDLNFD